MNAAAILTVEHLTMRFGGLVAVSDLSFSRTFARDHRADRTEWRRQDHFIQLHHRLLQADRRPTDACSSRRRHVLARAHAGVSHRPRGACRAHVSERAAVRRHDAARKSARRPAQHPDGRLRLYFARPVRLARLRARRSAAPSTRRVTGSIASASPSAPTTLPARCPTARNGGWKSRAPCVPIRCCSASTSRPPG